MRFLLKNRLFAVLFFFILLASIVAKSFWGIPAIIIVVFCHYLIPGLALQKLAGYMSYKDYNQMLLSSYCVGYAFSVVLYAVLLILGFHHYVLIFSLVIFVFSTIYLRHDFKIIVNLDDKNTGYVSMVLFACLSIVFFCFQLNCLSASVVDYQNTYYDLVYWHRNAVAATISYPLPDLSLMSKDIYYHYFSSLGIADIHYVSGIDLPNLCYTYSYVINIPLLVGSTYLISSEFIKKRLLIIIACLLILFGTTLEEITYTNYYCHLYYYSFGFTEGFSLSLLSYYFYHKIDGLSIKSLFIPLLVFVAAVGSKAPVAMVVLGGILFCCVNVLFTKGERRRIVLGVIYAILFLLVLYCFVLDVNPHIEGAGNGRLRLSYDTVFFPPFFKELFSYIYHYIPFSLIPLIAVFFTYILINSYMFLIGAFLLIRRNSQVKWRNTELPFLFMFVSGYLLFLFLAHSGFSQAYFYFIAVPFGFLYIISVFDQYNFSLDKKEKVLVLIVCVMAIFCIIYSIKGEVLSGINKLVNKQNMEQEVSANSLSSEELDALIWVRQNLPKSSILISNKCNAKLGLKSVVVSAYTERQTYMEGHGYSGYLTDKTIGYRNKLLLDFFSGSVDALKQMKKEGVTHFIRFENIPISLPNKGMKVVYKNRAVTVFELLP